ncbi:ABC transporter permease [Paenibacillus sp. y28]|uniref:ABC transporter permease n=1 Tax=Paenibacillus sp. y28 TaxID=3129110 RepID=UPI003019C030
MKAGFINELMLLYYRKKIVAFGVISILLPVAMSLVLTSVQPLLGLIGMTQGFPVQMLTLYTGIWLPLFIMLVTADLFPAEIAGRTLKLALLRPSSRLQVFASKAAALGAVTGALLVLLGLVTFLCTWLAGASGSLPDGLNMIGAYAAALVSMLALSALFIAVGQFFKSAGGFMISALILYGAAKLAPFWAPAFAAFSPTAYTSWHELWLSPIVGAGKLWTSGLFLISSTLLFLAVGYYKFDRISGKLN